MARIVGIVPGTSYKDGKVPKYKKLVVDYEKYRDARGVYHPREEDSKYKKPAPLSNKNAVQAVNQTCIPACDKIHTEMKEMKDQIKSLMNMNSEILALVQSNTQKFDSLSNTNINSQKIDSLSSKIDSLNKLVLQVAPHVPVTDEGERVQRESLAAPLHVPLNTCSLEVNTQKESQESSAPRDSHELSAEMHESHATSSPSESGQKFTVLAELHAENFGPFENDSHGSQATATPLERREQVHEQGEIVSLESVTTASPLVTQKLYEQILSQEGESTVSPIVSQEAQENDIFAVTQAATGINTYLDQFDDIFSQNLDIGSDVPSLPTGPVFTPTSIHLGISSEHAYTSTPRPESVPSDHVHVPTSYGHAHSVPTPAELNGIKAVTGNVTQFVQYLNRRLFTTQERKSGANTSGNASKIQMSPSLRRFRYISKVAYEKFGSGFDNQIDCERFVRKTIDRTNRYYRARRAPRTSKKKLFDSNQ